MSSKHVYMIGEWSIIHMYAKGLKTEILVDDKGRNILMNFNLDEEVSVHLSYKRIITILPLAKD